MKILVLSNNELSLTNAGGNTFANWLTGWPEAEISSLYLRSTIPHNQFCDSYYRVSPTSLLRHFFTPWKIGAFCNKNEVINLGESKVEASLVTKTKLSKNSFFHVVNDILVSLKFWQNKRYKEYIKDFNPDIVFYFAKADAFIYHNLKYLKQHTNTKFVAFFADDMYSIYQDKGIMNWIRRHRYPKMMNMGDLNFGASVMMCDTYTKRFGIPMTPLYKGCQLTAPKTTVNKPIRIVYAGNLFYGREQTLARIAKALKQINKEEVVALLEIYTNAFISDEIDALLNISGASKIMGSRPYSEIQQILKECDIVLHVESFKSENIKIVRLSYSTKISDCMQSGSAILVVGPNGIASVEELENVPGTKVVTDENEIEDELRSLLKNPNQLTEMAKESNNFARKSFSIEQVQGKLQREFSKLIK